ncbi:sensor c-di-GMP phosphodiesterase, contains CSS-motif sensor and EAL domain [Kaistia soli DSM 19436]|uniref:cyclic-guanylate-specific phosphodiesterase n=1 Tax=Kaistia soli DSM 19436 TaxID=1122133 RepID=A0A1M4XNA4_9HYPH|nr:EAL domain-containing protein [Kaistia soli]SHE94969.1 sensor c-di-GMP phosphodiesterase, contains CSS-motif sensor and EAL domain [Kaistia soli DSM 19436]
MSIGVIAVIATFEVIHWQRRHSELAFQAELILRRSVAVATEVRSSLRTVPRLKTEPCSPEDLKALRLLVERSAFIVEIGRTKDNRILCDSDGIVPNGGILGPADRITSRGTKVWLRVPLRGDWRLVVSAAEANDVVIFTRPTAADDLFRSLGDAVAAVVPPRLATAYASSKHSDQLTGAAYTPVVDRWFEQNIHQCRDGFDLCVVVSEPAQMGFSRLSLGEKLALLCGGALLGRIAQGFIGTWLTSRRTLYRRLKRAIDRNQITVHYQPLVRLDDRVVVGFETLARWPLPNGDHVSPDVFIPLAERTGLLPALTEFVIDRALCDMSGLLSERPDLYVSINIAVQSLLSEELLTVLKLYCDAYGVERSRIVLEITERETGDVKLIGDAVGRLRAAGFRIFLDDFGAGYSSLAYLATLPIDTIKLDKLFSNSVGTSLVGSLVLDEILHMMSTLNLSVVFEGIETEEQATALGAIAPGAMGQGWLFGRPVPIGDLPTSPSV